MPQAPAKRDVGKENWPTPADPDAGSQSTPPVPSEDTGTSSVEPATPGAEAPKETEVQRLKRENIDVDVVPEEANVNVQLVEGADVNIVSVGGKDYDFASETVQTVTPTEASLLSELDSVEVAS